MKTTFYLFLIVLACNATFTSCNKNSDNPTPQQLDSLNAALPKQIIIVESYDSNGIQKTIISDVYSIKYDTANKIVQLYIDDTTNTNPYDVLTDTYTYNSSDYLISIKEGDDNNTEPPNQDIFYNVTINRGADNNINYIAEVSKDGSYYDSIFYKYAPSNGATVITTVSHYQEGTGGNTGEDTSVYTYNSNHGLTQLAEPNFQTNTSFSLNANGSVNSYVSTTPDFTLNVNFTYASGLPDGTADAFTQVLMGKDYYLADVLNLDPFVLPFISSGGYDGTIDIPVTDPYHLSSANFQATGGNESQTFNWSYQLNAQNNVTQVVMSNSNNSHAAIKLKY